MSLDPNLIRNSAINQTNNQSNSNTSPTLSGNEDISIFESYSDHASEYNSSEWENLEPEENSFLFFKTGGYTYTTPDGTTIELDDIENVIVKVNKETGEIIVVGAENATIKGSNSGVKINIYDSSISNLSSGNGLDNINLYNTDISGNINTASGNDVVNLYEGSVASNVNTGDGNDSVNLYDSSTVKGKLNTAAGNDTVRINEKSEVNSVVTGSGDDNIFLNNAEIKNSISAGDGKDTININNKSTVSGNIDCGSGNDTLNINNSNVNGLISGGAYLGWGGLVQDNDKINISNNSTVNNINADSGDDNIKVENSTVKGKIEGNGGDDFFTINNSHVNEIVGGVGNDTVNISNSEAADINAGMGDDIILIDGSDIQNIDSGQGNDNIDIDDSNARDINGGSGDDIIDISNSKVGIVDGGTGINNIYYDEDGTSDNLITNDEDNTQKIDEIGSLADIQNLSENSAETASEITDNIAFKYTDRILTEEEQYYVLIIDTFSQNLENMTAQFEEQENEDGAIRDAYNWIKQLTDLGISKEDIKAAIDEQKQMIEELTAALNGEGDETFEEVYKKWTGIEYNQNNIIEYLESSQLYSFAVNGIAKAEAFASQISSVNNLGEVLELYQGYYGEEKGREKLNELLKDAFFNNPNVFGWVKSVEINENNEFVVSRADDYTIQGPIEGTEYTTTVEDIYSVTNMIKTMPACFDLSIYQDEFSKTFENTMGYSIERLQTKYASSQIKALGDNTSIQKLIDKYCADQEGFADKLSAAAQIGGIGLMIIGGVVTFVCPPAGVALMSAGKWTAIAGTFSDNALELIDDLASENGLSQEEAWSLMKESITEVVLLYSGYKINGVANNAKNIVLSATQNKALAFMSEIGTDASLSLLTDLMITGEIDLTGEGISQLLGIITGIAGAKVDTYTKEAFDSADTLFKQGDINGAYDYLTSKGISGKQIYNKYYQSEIDRITQYYKNTGDYDAAMNMFNSSKILGINVESSKTELVEALKNVEYEKIYEEFEAETAVNPDSGSSFINKIKNLFSKNKVLSAEDADAIVKNLETRDVINRLKSKYNIDLSKYKKLDFSSEQGKLVAQDIDLTYKAALQGTDVNNLMVPSVKNASEGLSKVQIGDVFEIEGTDNIFIKTADDSYEELNISKSLYCELFPAVSRYASGQQHSGDCYLVSALNTMMSKPSTRTLLLSCFTENPDGSVTVKMPTSGTEIIRQPGQSISDLGVDPTKAVTGSLGVQLLEYLYKVDYSSKKITESQRIVDDFNADLLEIYNSNEAYFKDQGITAKDVSDNPSVIMDYIKEVNETVKNEIEEISGMTLTEEQCVKIWFYLSMNSSFYNEAISGLGKLLNITDSDTLNQIYSKYRSQYEDISYDIYSYVNYDMSKVNEARQILNDQQYFETAAGHGGFSSDVFAAFGLTDAKFIRTEKDTSMLDKLIANPEMQDNYAITASSALTKNDLRKIYNDPSRANYQFYHDNPQIYQQRLQEAPESLPYGLVSNHAYSFEVTTNNAGETVIKVTNPWNMPSARDKKIITLTVEEFKQYFEGIFIADIPQT